MILAVPFSSVGADLSTLLVPLGVYLSLGHTRTQLVDNLISQPVLFGKSVTSHPLEFSLAILIGGLIFAVAGINLAVPS